MLPKDWGFSEDGLVVIKLAGTVNQEENVAREMGCYVIDVVEIMRAQGYERCDHCNKWQEDSEMVDANDFAVAVDDDVCRSCYPDYSMENGEQI